MRGMSSNELTLSPLVARSAPSNSTAACGSRTARNAVANERSAGWSLRHAAVMTPSVPSAPTNSALMS